MSDTPNVDELTYGIDMGAPNGDKTAISIKDGNTMHVFVGAGAEVIIKLITQAKQQACDDIVGLLPEEIEEEDGWDIYFTNGKEKGRVRPCCPGDDIAYAHNTCRTTTIKAINEYREGL